MWWREGVLYHIYTRSWVDSDGDGVGDLRGVIERLDYLVQLGIDGLWLSPIMPSPNRDWGYDVADYRSVQAEYGTLETFDELIAEAKRRGIGLIFDVVPSHTSDEHPWFIESRRSLGSAYRDYYVWRPPGPEGPPNGWRAYFGGPAWSLDRETGEYYLHRFSAQQPQLNWWNPRVRAEFDDIFRFWLDRGVAGLRIDALQALLHEPSFEESVSTLNGDDAKMQEILRRWRNVADEGGIRRLLFGETWVQSVEDLAAFYSDGTDTLDLAWNVPFLQSSFDAASLRSVIDRTLLLLPRNGWAVWAMSTHDSDGRAATRWCGGNSDAIRCALLILLAIKGTPVLYYGDEIGMLDASDGGPPRERRDRISPTSRDRSRSPMQWSDGPGAGFTWGRAPWLPAGDAATASVAEQEADPHSVLSLARDVIRLRRDQPALAGGSMRFVASPEGVIAWMRGSRFLVAVNLGSERKQLDVGGTIIVCTDRSRDGQVLRRGLELGAFEGAIALVRP